MFQAMCLSGSLTALLVAWQEEFSCSNPDLRQLKFFFFLFLFERIGVLSWLCLRALSLLVKFGTFYTLAGMINCLHHNVTI